jgi:acyl-CoA dehydrogenase
MARKTTLAFFDSQGEYDESLRERAYKAGVLSPVWPVEHGGTPPPGFDAFHDLIWIDELARCGGGGILWSVFTGFGIALPPILSHGPKAMKEKVARDVISGKKIMGLAVSEPSAGSDVANLSTTAEKKGDFYIVNGAKKWITGGTRASFFTTAVRTGGAGMKGLSLLLVENPTPGLTVTRMKTQGWLTSSTAYLEFDDVKVSFASIYRNLPPCASIYLRLPPFAYHSRCHWRT